MRDNREMPAWIVGVLRKALYPKPLKRYAELSEFVYDLRHSNPDCLGKTRQPLLERNPVAFWRGSSLILAAAIVVMTALKSTLG